MPLGSEVAHCRNCTAKCSKLASQCHGGVDGTGPFTPTFPPSLKIGAKVPDYGRVPEANFA